MSSTLVAIFLLSKASPSDDISAKVAAGVDVVKLLFDWIVVCDL
jgi:hypothetical protein